MKKILTLLILLSFGGQAFANFKGFFVNYPTAPCNNPLKLPQFDKYDSCVSDVRWVMKDGKYGFADNQGNILVPLDYERAEGFKNGIGFAKKGSLWYAFDTQGKQLYNFEAEDIENEYSDYAKIITKRMPTTYGIINKKTGKIGIPAVYSKLDTVKEDRVGFEKNGKYGFLNMNNKVIVPAIYDGIGQFYNGFAVVFKNGKSGVITATGKLVIPTIYEKIYTQEGGFEVFQNKKAGFINYQGKLIIPIKYVDIRGYYDGLARVRTDDNSPTNFGYFNAQGKKVIDFSYEYANDFSEGLAAVKNTQKKYGYINTKGQIVISFNFDDADEFKKGIARVKLGEKYALIDKSGNNITGFIYDYLSTYDYDYHDSKTISVKKDGVKFEITPTGERLN